MQDQTEDKRKFRGDQAEGHPALAWVVSWYTTSMSVEKDACRHADRMALTEQTLTKQLYHQLEQSPIPERQTQRRVCRDLKDALSEQLFPFVQRIRPASSNPPSTCPAAARTLSPAVKQFLDEKGT